MPQSQPGKLKTLPLPKFDGDILQFKLFWDQFELKNYSEVVQTLKNRFYRLQDVVEIHVLSVVGLKACATDGDAELTRLHDELNRHSLELKAFKLRSGSVTEWKAFVKDKRNDEITSDVFLAFLLEQARIREEFCITTAAVRVESGEECSICGGDHSTDDCPRFLRQPLRMRRHQLCLVCLWKGHCKESCPKRKPGQARKARRIRARKKGRKEAIFTEQMRSPPERQRPEKKESFPGTDEERILLARPESPSSALTMIIERDNLLEIFSNGLRTSRTNDDDYWLIPVSLTVAFSVNFLLQKGYLKSSSKPSNSFSFEFSGLHSRDLQIHDGDAAVKTFRTTKAGEDFLLWKSASRHILVFATGSNNRLQAPRRNRGMDAVYVRVKMLAHMGLFFKAAVLRVNLNPQTIICDFEIALIPLS
ncbi:hypothetical protein T4B_14660 [Trichinella pseudospiralis]|uniref:Uncharacterized protein n=1 Tax=Trichinella pseudospiralis TaxID=6337 RepID=A0A0V1HRF2_TRIPS|nr:hypothetical protein T4B_14660 [Trichinella pseudospiralis]KRZ32109.1 hypothetical protein T4C_8195 [Trichinella pseudospiralis]